MTPGREAAPAPRVSVVIPSGRGARLAFTLEALAGQSLDSAEFEVVVARDPRGPDPSPAPEGIEVRFLSPPAAGNIAALRNAGWREARAPRVAFTDDDCRPAQDWLERLLAASAGRLDLVQGRTEPDPDEAHLLHGLARSQRIVGPSPFFQGCNLLYHRSLLEELGGFDERFGLLGEDTDLALRAKAAGARPRYVDEALVWHAVIPRTLPAALREARERNAMPALVGRHPELRDALYGRYFWRRSHALLLLAGIGLAGSRRNRALAALALPYAARALDPRTASGPRSLLRRALHLPLKALVDSAELVATASTAARERTLLV